MGYRYLLVLRLLCLCQQNYIFFSFSLLKNLSFSRHLGYSLVKTLFNDNGNDFAEKTGWIGKDDGILVRDLNNNGQIDNGSELFGDQTVLSNGKKAANGFESLADLDSNPDGIFDSDNDAFGEVMVWQDVNEDRLIKLNPRKNYTTIRSYQLFESQCFKYLAIKYNKLFPSHKA